VPWARTEAELGAALRAVLNPAPRPVVLPVEVAG
jgi:hypothetical protein